MKVRVITFDTKETTIEDKTFPEFNSDDFDVYLSGCYEKLEKGEIYGIKIIRADNFSIQHEKAELCVPAVPA